MRTNQHIIRNLALVLATVTCLLLGGGFYLRSLDIKPPPPPPKKVANPLWQKWKPIAQRYKLDLSFAKAVHIQDKMISGRKTIFCHQPASLDVIIIGDSSLAWGVIPQVVEKVSGLKVAFIANRSMFLNKRSLKILERFRSYYLKPNGLTIYTFDNWTQLMSPGLMKTRHLITLEEMDGAEFVSFAQAKEKQCNADALSASVTDEPLFSGASFQAYDQNIVQIIQVLSHKGWVLPAKSFYAENLEPSLNPNWHRQKMRAEERIEQLDKRLDQGRQPDAKRIAKDKKSYAGIRWIRWDERSVTPWLEAPRRFSIYDKNLPAKGTVSKAQRINAQYLLSLPGAKAYMIPIFPAQKHYRQARLFYKALYKKGGVTLINLGALHPKGRRFPMDKISHMLNEGGLVKSALIGRWLRDNWKSKPDEL